jgi:cleavage and polyadenylation specificity factor subunit 2
MCTDFFALAQIYATLPVQKMGQLTMYDIVLSRQAKEDFDLFSLADVDTAWDNFVQLRYQQSVSLSGKAEGITVSPLNAGHMIGGALWKITKDSEEIVYAVDYNHAQDRHLDGTVLVDLPRPNILITDAYTALDPPMTGGRKAREGRLLEQITAALQRGGNVLLPSDSTGRVLELMILLDEYWTQNNMRNVTLAFFSPEGRSTLDMAASQTEWLSKHVNQRFVQSRRNVFHFEHLRRCCSRQELASLPFPQVVLASGLDLETSSFSLDLFAEWAGDPRNAVVLTHKARPGCFARRLIDGCLAGTPPPREPVVLQVHPPPLPASAPVRQSGLSSKRSCKTVGSLPQALL